MKSINNGAYVTMITPYDARGNVDYGAVKALTEWYYEKGLDGIFASCQSGEIWRLDRFDRAKITEVTVLTANELQKKYGRKMDVISSGNVGWSKAEQADELKAQLDAGSSAAVIITNRLDLAHQGDDKWIEDMDELLCSFSSDATFGLYECPYPYKRLLSTKILEYLAGSGKFVFVKDTCCDHIEIKRRLDILGDCGLKIYNANAQTLLRSLRDGAAGYSGVMANFHPELYVWLCHNVNHPLADEVAGFLTCAAFTEQLGYPVTAKYHLSAIEGLPINLSTRNPNVRFGEYDKLCVESMNDAAKALTEKIKLNK